MTYWINTVSADHVQRGVAGGFTQANHGKPHMLRKMARDDWIIFYSPKTALEGGEPLQAFTADGPINLRNAKFGEDQAPLDPTCGCPVCATWSRAYILHLVRAGGYLPGDPVPYVAGPLVQFVRERVEQFSALASQLTHARTSHEELRRTTSSLASALRSTSARGQCGEVELQRILEAAGLLVVQDRCTKTEHRRLQAQRLAL